MVILTDPSRWEAILAEQPISDPDLRGGDNGAAARPQAAAPAGADRRLKIVEALMTLAAHRDWHTISLADMAAEAGVSLADLRDAFPSKGAVLGGFIRMIDRMVLDGATDDLAAEPARERLFDVMMRRFDALAPYRPALRRIVADLRNDPLALVALRRETVNSQRFMLASAGIDTEGPMGAVRLQGAVCVFNRVFETWLDDEDPGFGRTLARLDEELGRGEKLLGIADDLYRLSSPFRALGCALLRGPRAFGRRPRHGRDGDMPDQTGEDTAPAGAI